MNFDKEFLDRFNPANAQTLTEGELKSMESFSDQQIKALADTYPNKATGNGYLILKDTTLKAKQLFPRSTWANLYDLRNMANMKNFVAMTFVSRFQGNEASKPALFVTSTTQDLSKTEALPGLKTGETQNTEVTDKVPPVQSPENGSSGAGTTQIDGISSKEGLPTQTDVTGKEGAKNDEEFLDLSEEAKKLAEGSTGATNDGATTTANAEPGATSTDGATAASADQATATSTEGATTSTGSSDTTVNARTTKSGAKKP